MSFGSRGLQRKIVAKIFLTQKFNYECQNALIFFINAIIEKINKLDVPKSGGDLVMV